MGISILGGCSSSPYCVPDSNPNPSKFKIEWMKRCGNFLMLVVHYPDAKNLEGRKILILDTELHIEDVLAAADGKLDPHFSEAWWSPVARFPSTNDGFWMAMEFIQFMSKRDTR